MFKLIVNSFDKNFKKQPGQKKNGKDPSAEIENLVQGWTENHKTLSSTKMYFLHFYIFFHRVQEAQSA